MPPSVQWLLEQFTMTGEAEILTLCQTVNAQGLDAEESLNLQTILYFR